MRAAGLKEAVMQNYTEIHLAEDKSLVCWKSIMIKLFVVACLLLGFTAAHAQFGSASVIGYVRDNSGAVVQDATVTLVNVATNVSLAGHTTKKESTSSTPYRSAITRFWPARPGLRLPRPKSSICPRTLASVSTWR